MASRRQWLVQLALVLLAGCHRTSSVPTAPTLDPAGRLLLDPVRDDALRPQALLARLRLPADAIVADIGAGPGYLTLPLAAAVSAGRVIAIDLRSDYLAVLSARAQAAKLRNIETRVSAVDDPKLLADSIDLAVLCQVDHYLPDRAAYLSRLRAALHPGGRIALINYSRYEEADQAAAEAAGLRIVDEWSPSVAFFLLLLAPDAAAGMSRPQTSQAGQGEKR